MVTHALISSVIHRSDIFLRIMGYFTPPKQRIQLWKGDEKTEEKEERKIFQEWREMREWLIPHGVAL